MPSTVNGIGTWYWGKTDLHVTQGTCEFCGSFGKLSSYDTTLYFVVLFVPLIPLKKVHVIDQCPRCSKHRLMNLRQWQESCNTALAKAMAEYQAEPTNAEKAAMTVKVAVFYRQQEAFTQLAAVIRRSLPHDAGTHALLGGGFEFFGDQAEAEASYRRSLQLKADAGVSRDLGLLLLRADRPDEAESLIIPIIDPTDVKQIGLRYLLVEGQQAAGQHQRALSLLDALLADFPELDTNGDFRRYRKTSEKHRASGKRVVSSTLRTMGGATGVHTPRRARLAKLVAPIILLGILAIYFVVALMQGQSREVFVVNGLSTPYSVDVNGRIVRLSPNGYERIAIPEGPVNVHVVEGGLNIPQQTCRIETPLLTRPFLNRTFVINPDRLALVIVESVEYGDTANASTVELRPSQLRHELAGLDYRFESFPQSIRAEKGTDHIHKKRVAMVTELKMPARVLAVMEKLGKGQALEYLRCCARTQPNEQGITSLVGMLLEPQQAMEVVRPNLAARPVMIEWHRLYQSLMELTQPEHDLRAEYAGYLKRDSRNGAMKYLLGRVTEDRQQARQLFLQAAESRPPVGYGYHALAYDYVCEGNYALGLDYARRAIAAAPDEAAFRVNETVALEAMGQYQQLLEINQRLRDKDPLDGMLAAERAYLLSCTGRAIAAQQEMEQYLSQLVQVATQQECQQWRRRTAAVIAYASGDARTFAKELTASDSALEQCYAAIADGRLDDAQRIRGGISGKVEQLDLILYVAATDAGRKDIAEVAMQSAIVSLRGGQKDDRRMAQWLSSEKACTPAEAAATQQLPEAKRLMLAALAMRFPADRAAYLAAAKRLNQSRMFPYLLIARLADIAAK